MEQNLELTVRSEYYAFCVGNNQITEIALASLRPYASLSLAVVTSDLLAFYGNLNQSDPLLNLPHTIIKVSKEDEQGIEKVIKDFLNGIDYEKILPQSPFDNMWRGAVVKAEFQSMYGENLPSVSILAAWVCQNNPQKIN